MALVKGNTGFTGTYGGICIYFSRGSTIYRSASSLTGKRVKKDPAFKGFRESSNRMKEASPIASSLYSRIPKEQRQFALYRLLTGEALKMIKQNKEKSFIIAQLYELYIAPLLRTGSPCYPIQP